MLKFLAKEPQLLYTLLAALGAAFAIDDLWIRVGCAAAALLLGLIVRQSVASPATVAAAVENAATQTAQSLSEETVGAIGETTETGTNVVKAVTDMVLHQVGGLIPRLTRSK